MRWCEAGHHIIWSYTAPCKEHGVPPPSPEPDPDDLPLEGRADRDPPAAGRCSWGNGHWAPAIWALPKDGKYYCLAHLTRIVRIATWGTK